MSFLLLSALQARQEISLQVDCLVWISCLQPSVVETAQTAQVQGINIVAKSCLLSKPTQLWQLFSTTDNC